MKSAFKIISPLFVFYLLAITQSSFLAHLAPKVFMPNLVLLSAALYVILENPKNNFGYFVSFWAGLFIDLFSGGPMGNAIIYFLLFCAVSKFLLKKYVRIPIAGRA